MKDSKKLKLNIIIGRWQVASISKIPRNNNRQNKRVAASMVIIISRRKRDIANQLADSRIILNHNRCKT